MQFLRGSDLVLPVAPPLELAAAMEAYRGATPTQQQWAQVNYARFVAVSRLQGEPSWTESLGPEGETVLRSTAWERYRAGIVTQDDRDAATLVYSLALLAAEVGEPTRREQVWQWVAAGVLVVVGAGAIAAAFSEWPLVVDRYLRDRAELAKLRELDAQALATTQQRLAWEAKNPGRAYPDQANYQQAMAALRAQQQALAQTRPLAPAPRGLFDAAAAAGQTFINSPAVWLVAAAAIVIGLLNARR